jgi:hypothetical protein
MWASLDNDKTEGIAPLTQPFAAYLCQYPVDLGKGLFGAGTCLAQERLPFFAMYACAVAAAHQIGCGKDNGSHVMAGGQGCQATGKLVADLAGISTGLM